jgi:sulfoxide reductase heme-binding subunit YedZ
VSNTDPGQHFFWLGSRALGVTAMVLLSLTVGVGLALAGRPRQRGLGGWLRHHHEAFALAALTAIAGHGLLLLGDSYLKPGLAGIAVPFDLPGQPIWTGLGIVGGWLAAVSGLSFYARDRIGRSRWRQIHRLTLVGWLLAVAHTFGSGSDAGAAWLLVIVVATGLPVAGLALARLSSGLPAPQPSAPAPKLSENSQTSLRVATRPPSMLLLRPAVRRPEQTSKGDHL